MTPLTKPHLNSNLSATERCALLPPDILAQFPMIEEWAAAADDLSEYTDTPAEVEALREQVPGKREREMLADYPLYFDFFRECFESLGRPYPAPDITSDHDRQVIFDAICKGEAAE